jgi:hypothetical protein
MPAIPKHNEMLLVNVELATFGENHKQTILPMKAKFPILLAPQQLDWDVCSEH